MAHHESSKSLEVQQITLIEHLHQKDIAIHRRSISVEEVGDGLAVQYTDGDVHDEYPELSGQMGEKLGLQFQRTVGCRVRLMLGKRTTQRNCSYLRRLASTEDSERMK